MSTEKEIDNKRLSLPVTSDELMADLNAERMKPGWKHSSYCRRLNQLIEGALIFEKRYGMSITSLAEISEDKSFVIQLVMMANGELSADQQFVIQNVIMSKKLQSLSPDMKLMMIESYAKVMGVESPGAGVFLQKNNTIEDAGESSNTVDHAGKSVKVGGDRAEAQHQQNNPVSQDAPIMQPKTLQKNTDAGTTSFMVSRKH